MTVLPLDSSTQFIFQVLEETGYNLIGKLKPEDVIELSIKEQRISLFIVSGVEEDFPFQTKTRKEISVSNIPNTFGVFLTDHLHQRIEWFRLADLPTWRRNKQVPGKFYLISPFIGYVNRLLIFTSNISRTDL